MAFQPCLEVYNPVSVHPQIWSNDYSQRDFLCDGDSFLYWLKFETRPFPCAISEWPMNGPRSLLN